MKSYFLLVILSMLALQTIQAQSNKLEKQMEKVNELVQKNKLEDAEKMLTDLLKNDPYYGKAWDLLAKIRYHHYENSKSTELNFGGKITVTTKNADGSETESADDSLANSLMQLLNSMSPKKIAYNKYLHTLRKATLHSNDAYLCSIYLRMAEVDMEVDTNVHPKALKHYNEAEKEFQNKNYHKAALLYQRAIELQPDFYKAHLYLGDSYYFQGNYVHAIASFKKAIERFPDLIEPRKYLVDAYAKEKLYEKALEEAILAMTVYPDLSVKAKLEDAAYFNGQRLEIKWTPRAVFPVKIEAADSADTDINSYRESDPKEPVGPWIHYLNAAEKIKTNCDERGVITKTFPETETQYIEVFAWEEMLRNSDDEILAEARKMQQEGFLDCYVLVTCFHQDFYDQYSHFVNNHRDKVVKYYKTFLASR